MSALVVSWAQSRIKPRAKVTKVKKERERKAESLCVIPQHQFWKRWDFFLILPASKADSNTRNSTQKKVKRVLWGKITEVFPLSSSSRHSVQISPAAPKSMRVNIVPPEAIKLPFTANFPPPSLRTSELLKCHYDLAAMMGKKTRSPAASVFTFLATHQHGEVLEVGVGYRWGLKDSNGVWY